MRIFCHPDFDVVNNDGEWDIEEKTVDTEDWSLALSSENTLLAVTIRKSKED